MRWYKRDIGRRLTLRFWDHSIGLSEPIRTELDGRFIGATRRAVRMQWWHTPNNEDVDNKDAIGAIVRSTIIGREWLD